MSANEAAVQRRSNRESAARDFRRLDAVVAGTVLGPADPGWNAAPRAWSLSVDQRPAAVALPQSAEDVVVIVDFAREHGLRLAPQGTGHNAHPLERRLANSLLVKTERMRAVEIDLGLGALAAKAGAVWMDLRVPPAQHGRDGGLLTRRRRRRLRDWRRHQLALAAPRPGGQQPRRRRAGDGRRRSRARRS